MPASRPILPPAEVIDSHDALLLREGVGERRRRRRRWLIVLGALALTAAAVTGARPALHMAKAWQARRHAREAVRLTEAGNFEEARAKVQDALTIWRNEPEATYAAAFFLTRAGAFRPALAFWQQLDTVRPLTPAELRDYAATEIALGDNDAAEAILRRVWPAGGAGTWQDWVLALQIESRRGHGGEAVKLANQLLREGAVPPRERLSAAVVVFSSTASSPEEKSLAWKVVGEISHDGRSPESLAALLLLAQQRSSLSNAPGADDPIPPLPELIDRIDSHPQAKTQHHLLALDLRLAQEPSRRQELIQQAVDRFGASKEDADLATLTGWLYGKGEFDKVLAVLPPARAVGDRALYLQYLDTLAALGRWPDIRQSIQEKKFALDPMLAQMFLARCAGQLGETDVRDARWHAAVEAAGKDPGKLLGVGQYALKNGAVNIAADALEAALKIAPDQRPAHEELVRLLETTGDTRKLRAAVADMAGRWPQDLSIRNDLAYLDALLNENVDAARSTARELVRLQPGNLTHRATLALADLRLHDALSALDAFNGAEIRQNATLQPRQAAVYAVVLWETSYAREAAQMLKNIPTDRLLPEERELVRPINGVVTP